MDLEKEEPEKCSNDRNISKIIPRRFIVHLSSLVSIATASICISLIALYHQSEAALIVMTCSNILYGLGSFAFTTYSKNVVLRPLHGKLMKMVCIFMQFITIGAAVEYLDDTRKHPPLSRTELHNALLIAIDCLLLISLLTNGVVIGFLNKSANAHDFNNDKTIESYYQSSEKFVPLKNSTQTLTPSLDLFQTNQDNSSNPCEFSDTPIIATSDEVSFPSVLKHKMTNRHLAAARDGLSTNGESNPSIVSKSSRRKNSLLFRLRSSKYLKTKRQKSEKTKTSIIDTKKGNIDDRYVSRLSTIPDLSRSILNLINSSSADVQSNNPASSRRDKTASQFTETSKSVSQALDCQELHNPSSPSLELERNAIQRINSALLPPCLSVVERPLTMESDAFQNHAMAKFSSSSERADNTERILQMSPNILEKNDLGDIPAISFSKDDGFDSYSPGFNNNMDLPEVVTLGMWEKNKSSIIERAEGLRENILLPAFQFTVDEPRKVVLNGIESKPDFSYPSKQKKSSFADDSLDDENSNCDTMSAVEDYFNDISTNGMEDESKLMQEGFKHNKSSSFIMERASKELIRTSTRHSPTKSIISIISGNSISAPQRAQTVQSGYVTGSNEKRSLSQANHFFSNSGSHIFNSPSKSSPTRSHRLKKIGKKLSMSNISDSMINHYGSLENTNEQFSTQRQLHKRGTSIDFSYVLTLQSNHSPTKSVSGSILKDRRHSLVTENGFRTASGLFNLQNGNLRTGYDPDDVHDTTLSRNSPERHVSSSTSSEKTTRSSAASGTSYPELVMSEYDRERWNTLVSLDKIAI
ncbi:hypothetical protein HG535_0C04830 [Zygotorulaspora mrakii]|uniref:Uncharacterized protein n=1 Tax=Zygotorulaspora mrakii TaxID=42260 RepID=A0A7H9B2B6_ZYGMR|nr:uncharacterized protein HG535_0C04830 [Zygotorulaspora mrakii]QLG72129.1 hypothetical protein HG535_0C04830 [Zygotorulaspora mrakii]